MAILALASPEEQEPPEHELTVHSPLLQIAASAAERKVCTILNGV